MRFAETSILFLPKGPLFGMPMPLAPESSTGHGFQDQRFHREGRAGDELLDCPGCAPDAVGLAPLVRSERS
jgi:hypothetical protein